MDASAHCLYIPKDHYTVEDVWIYLGNTILILYGEVIVQCDRIIKHDVGTKTKVTFILKISGERMLKIPKTFRYL